MIRDHVFRPAHPGRGAGARARCGYLGTCGRPRAEHERAVRAIAKAGPWRGRGGAS